MNELFKLFKKRFLFQSWPQHVSECEPARLRGHRVMVCLSRVHEVVGAFETGGSRKLVFKKRRRTFRFMMINNFASCGSKWMRSIC